MTPTVPEFVNVVVSDGSQDAAWPCCSIATAYQRDDRQVYQEVVAAAS